MKRAGVASGPANSLRSLLLIAGTWGEAGLAPQARAALTIYRLQTVLLVLTGKVSNQQGALLYAYADTAAGLLRV